MRPFLFRPRRTSLPGQVPTVEQIRESGMMLNVADGRMWVALDDGRIVEMVAKDADTVEVVKAIGAGVCVKIR